ncbi:hypothetical protein POJ06DRAFT_17350 [Lipomyces tetrasporus]|uniref:MINDY deubiquitinase domain-containing protein n=1 Tax=Lipomyces tetrasporus TaxID=54092 RepID=A0AAD7VW59_9ASCO|nr:uncharacterized protein POJ06DRAFT_17350 [Lipomyces tetrasporus]KAJ8104288.1 hypothetical protein POJ06DRAFT_17350 [Lipomyces tetrasporus]
MVEEPYMAKTEDKEDKLEPAGIFAPEVDNGSRIVVSEAEPQRVEMNEAEVSTKVANSIVFSNDVTSNREQEFVPALSEGSNVEQQTSQVMIPGASTEHVESAMVEATESVANLEVRAEPSEPDSDEAASSDKVDSEAQPTTSEETTSSMQSQPPEKTKSKVARPSLDSSVFKVRSVKWYDPYGRTRESPIVLQNENGPCPLLALVNTLILSTPPGQNTPLSRISTTRTEINALYLLELLGDLLLSSNAAETTDVNNVLSLLPSLHTGLNINPRFDGTFEESEELALFRAFEVDLVHGWVSNPDNRFVHNSLMKATSYEGAQGILVAMSELSAKLDTGESLSANELQTMEDGRIIEHFLNQTATQLTTFGLSFLSELLLPGSFAVFFRNDHFSTIYRHPDSKQIFMLVTDAGFSSHKNIVWESLNDITGSSSLFFNGVFIPSEFGDSEPEKKAHVPQIDGDGHTVSHSAALSLDTHDHDYALAMELQMNEDRALALDEARREEEEARRAARRASAPSQNRTAQFAQTQPSQHGSSARRAGVAASASSRRPSKPPTVYAPYGQEARNLLNEFQPGTPGASSTSARHQSGSRSSVATSSNKRTSSEKDKCIVT